MAMTAEIYGNRTPLPTLDSTFGALLIGTLIGVLLYGMIIHQAYQYFRIYTTDSSFNKVLVCSLITLETCHIVACAHSCYYYLVSSYGNPEALAGGVWSINVLSVLSGIIIILSQSFFARRVYLIGSAFRVLVGIAAILLVGELGFFSAATAQAFADPEFTYFRKYTWLISTGAALAVVADGLLTSVLVTVLRQSTTGVKRMDKTIDTIILYTVSTGLLTSVVNLLMLIFSLFSTSTLIYAAFGIVCTKLYVNSLLAALNARKHLAERVSRPLMNFRSPGRRDPHPYSPSHVSTFAVREALYRLAPLDSPTFPLTPRASVMPSPARAQLRG